MLFKSLNSKAARILKSGGVGVILTDTIYGLVGSALNKETVEKIYKLRYRNPQKPMIVLIGRLSDLKKFDINLSHVSKKLVSKFWPGKVSIIFDCPWPKFHYLHRGTKSLALRIPKPAKLRAFLKKTGPLVAPSANLEDHPPAKTIKQAQKYFGDKVDFYIDRGNLRGKPSLVIKLVKDRLKVIRN